MTAAEIAVEVVIVGNVAGAERGDSVVAVGIDHGGADIVLSSDGGTRAGALSSDGGTRVEALSDGRTRVGVLSDVETDQRSDKGIAVGAGTYTPLYVHLL